MPSNKDINKEVADNYLNMYFGCLKFKDENKKDKIDCSEFYKKFEFHAIAYIDSKVPK